MASRKSGHFLQLVEMNDGRFIWQRAAVTPDNPLDPGPVLIYPEDPSQALVRLISTKARPVTNRRRVWWDRPPDRPSLAKDTAHRLNNPR